VDADIVTEDRFLDSEYTQVFQSGLPRLSELLPNLRRVIIRYLRWAVDIWELSRSWEQLNLPNKFNCLDYWEDL
jgi:hypothetical protein